MLELLGKKVGMTHIFTDSGVQLPITMVQLYDNCVVELIVNQDKEFNNLLLAFDKITNPKKISKSVSGIFNKKEVPLHRKIKGCRVPKNLAVKTGDIIEIDTLVKDLISIRGTSIGKGFAGVMKRHNFGGLEASHGVSVSHRSHGSTGQRQDPGKVFKGKKMAGHMGVDKVTVKNLEVLLIDKEKKIVGLKGAVPGNNGGEVVLKIPSFKSKD
jgi:large subunit ribosomal protein L3